jgi:hypothetical protein
MKAIDGAQHEINARTRIDYGGSEDGEAWNELFYVADQWTDLPMACCRGAVHVASGRCETSRWYFG